ncbi:hypothetical protein BKA67DRAFT_510103 [Truncatella angustata]|uniref:Uncharacterized protein n=1 Tax=Truncatella angustata TaxID=152316 RepID=A0A9P8UZ01_9PEZI|nr:uncharacterized protein BKA67DRAFT_510103 [Truncatella angustata]KAH6660957.1 hypothetical protein BKA67DRAFT_510103 [Truncatella angustata]
MIKSSRSAKQRPRYHVLRFWTWEILSLIVAIGLMAATVGILAHYQGQQVPDWPLSINLNTLVALLSTILRAAMLVAVAEVIGQLKYGHFAKPQSLKHLHDFDRASRSVNGSIKLLFVAPKSLLAVTGALVTIISLAIGPFTQQAIRSVTCPQFVADMNASIPVSHFVPGRAVYYRIGAGQWEVDTDMKGAMINGLTNPAGNDSAIVATCPTGNCTFPVDSSNITHSSIGMCSACIDTTGFVTKTENLTTNYTMPNNLWLSPGSGHAYLNVMIDYNLTWAESAFTGGFGAIARGALTNFTTMTFTQSSCYKNSEGVIECPHNVTGYVGLSDYVATSCSVYPCLTNYHADMSSGALDEQVVSTIPAPVNWVEANISVDGFSSGANYTALKSPCLIDNVMYDKTNFSEVSQPSNRTMTGINVDGTNYTVPDECLYKVEWLYGAALNAFMSETVFSGSCSYDHSQGGSLYCSNSWWLSPLYNQQNASFESISNRIGQYTTAITHKFRTVGSSNSDYSTKESTLGTVIEMTVCTEFDWRWLLMPLALLVASIAMLVLMMIRNYADHPRQPVWKSSVLPLLFHGLDSAPRTNSGPAMELDQMKEQANQIKAKFQTGAAAGFVDMTDAGKGSIRSRDVDMDSLVSSRQL